MNIQIQTFSNLDACNAFLSTIDADSYIDLRLTPFVHPKLATPAVIATLIYKVKSVKPTPTTRPVPPPPRGV